MNLIRKLAIPAIAAVAVLAGASTALATTSPATVRSTAQAPAAAHLVVSDRAATAGTPNAPDAFHWLHYGTYNTLHACKSEGDYLVLQVNSGYTFKCPQYTVGDYFVYELWVGVPG